MAEPCGGAPRWHGHVSGDGEAVAVPLTCARWRGRQGKASSVGNWLGRDGRRAALVNGQTWTYRHGGKKSAKLKLGSAFFMVGWVQAARELDAKAADVLN